MKSKLDVHLFFSGTCEEAFNMYKEVLGGEITFLFRKKEDKSQQVKDEEKEKIAYTVLSTNSFNIAGEDYDSNIPVVQGNNKKLVLSLYDLDDVHRVFDLLSQGGEIISPLGKTFFCDAFGELIDKYGIRWLIMMTDEGYASQE